MSKCPNCYYELVLLEHRSKYKCAKCGKLWNQKKIDIKEFKEWNKRERQESRKLWKKEAERNYQAEKIIPKIIEDLKNPKPQKTKEQYYEENRDKIIQQKRDYRSVLSGQAKKEQNQKRKERRYKNIDATRIQGRINYWRQQQKLLALLTLENELFNAYRPQSRSLLPTYLLS